MVETNIRIVAPGSNLRLATRLVGLTGQGISPDLKEKVCSALRRQGLASVDFPDGILVATDKAHESQGYLRRRLASGNPRQRDKTPSLFSSK